ncbi:tripartite tricarboxylate transporter TctB family protein [uncultured Enterovirga sp.]|uniref:tripartite tricarboxylate transporter TctB family protein n=1 Tax=uncultured Enterovirga sp. TaxID=2026352 RepID=UPI0035CAD96A
MPDLASEDERPVVRSRSVDIVVCLAIVVFAAVMAWDNWRTGARWAADGPEVGYFPFYLSILLGGAALVGLVSAILDHAGEGGAAFVTRDQLRRVAQVFVPTLLYVAAMEYLGLYVASFLLVAGFMMLIGRIAPWKSVLAAFVFVAVMFGTFEVAFNVIMPKGPLEAALGY